MNFAQYINTNSIVELTSNTFESAIRELLSLCRFRGCIDEVVSDLLSKEKEISSNIGNKILVPNLRVHLSSPYEIFVGRCRSDLKRSVMRDSEQSNIIVLILASKHERDYLSVVSSVVNIFQNASVVSRLRNIESFDNFKNAVISMFKKFSQNSTRNISIGSNEFFLREVVEIAHEARCSNVMLFGNIKIDNIDIETIFDGMKIVRIIHDKSDVHPVHYNSYVELHVSATSTSWLHGFRGAILFGITREIFNFDDKVCCIGCSNTPGVLDTMFIVDIQKEFRPILTSSSKFFQCDIRPEVLERTLSIASEIAMEGREGKSVGCLFVLGDINKISLFMKPLVLNPFYGYPEAERNILHPFMEETVKEFSLIDGAFVIRGDGIIESAGTLIYTPNHNIVMPSGFGTRHAAAASISWAAECIAIAVSESTHSVTLFHNGQMLQIMQM